MPPYYWGTHTAHIMAVVCVHNVSCLVCWCSGGRPCWTPKASGGPLSEWEDASFRGADVSQGCALSVLSSSIQLELGVCNTLEQQSPGILAQKWLSMMVPLLAAGHFCNEQWCQYAVPVMQIAHASLRCTVSPPHCPVQLCMMVPLHVAL